MRPLTPKASAAKTAPRLRAMVRAMSSERCALDDWDGPSLRTLAEWYRSWAQLAGNLQDRADRLSFAEHLEQLASGPPGG